MMQVAMVVMFVCSPAAAAADADTPFRFSSVYGDGMVLQSAPQPSTLWGFCSAGDVINIRVGSTGAPVRAAVLQWLNFTIWTATLPPTPASFVPVAVTATRKSDGRTASLQNVLFGDVWVCSGQSNMEYAIGGVNDSAAALAEMANYSTDSAFIKLFHVGHAKAESPQPEIPCLGNVSCGKAFDVKIYRCSNGIYPIRGSGGVPACSLYLGAAALP